MKPGDLLYFGAEDQTLMVVMSNENGVRYYDANNPEFTDEGSVITRFATYEELDESCTYVTDVRVITDMYIDRAHTPLSQTTIDILNDLMDDKMVPF